MPIQRRHRSPDTAFLDGFVESISHVAYDGAAGGWTTPDGCWDLVFRRRRGATQILQTGLITRPIPLDYEPGDEYLSVSFKPGVFMPMLPGERMLDHAFFRPNVGHRGFWLEGDTLEIPTFDNAEGLVHRLARRGLLVRDPIVTGALADDLRALSSQRTVQRHFHRTLGLSPKALQQILRARQAVALLERGRPILDVAFDLGFADQAHLTRSLKALTGQTPRAIARGAALVDARGVTLPPSGEAR